MRRRSVQRAGLGVMVTAASVALAAGCGAPRDPDLEERALRARLKAEAPLVEPPVSEPPPAPPPPPEPEGQATRPKKEATPVRRLVAAEVAATLARVEGVGDGLVATFETGAGTFSCRLFPAEAPETVANFVALATGAASGKPFYDGLRFHRAIDQFIIQSGNPTGAPGGGPGWRIAREDGLGKLFDAPGALGMVDDGDAIHGSQFFVTLRPDANLAKRYAAFGQCDALEVPRAIAAGPKRPATRPGESAAVPVEPVELRRVRLSRVEP
jgi:cyclophilin family peptidyl-prolyl cis-trans isomerase